MRNMFQSFKNVGDQFGKSLIKCLIKTSVTDMQIIQPVVFGLLIFFPPLNTGQ